MKAKGKFVRAGTEAQPTKRLIDFKEMNSPNRHLLITSDIRRPAAFLASSKAELLPCTLSLGTIPSHSPAKLLTNVPFKKDMSPNRLLDNHALQKLTDIFILLLLVLLLDKRINLYQSIFGDRIAGTPQKQSSRFSGATPTLHTPQPTLKLHASHHY